MRKSLCFICIPNHTYLKINFYQITPYFFKIIKKKYKHFLTNKFYGKNLVIKNVNIVSKKNFIPEGKIFYFREDFGIKTDFVLNTIQCFVVENIYSFDSMLRLIFSLVLFTQNGLLLHSSGIVYKNKGFLFVGRSGKGKSTLVKNSVSRNEDIKILSDELVGVMVINSSVFTYKSPFWGELKTDIKNFPFETRNQLFKVDKIFVLNSHLKTKNFVIKKLDIETAIIKLLETNLCLFNNHFLGKKIFSTVEKIVKSAKIYKLDFKKNFEINQNILETKI
jgi:hypothetical protein